MRSSSRVFWSLLAASAFSLPVLGMAACSATEDPAPGKTDTGVKKDSATGDAPVADEGVDTTPTGDSTPIDTGSKPDSTTETGGGGCDPHPGDKCDLVKQDCPGTQTCAFDGTSNVCTTRAIGAGTKGDPCSADGDCDRGLECQSNKCTPACCPGDNSVCVGSSAASKVGKCNVALTDSSGKTQYHICSYSSACNPFKYDCPSDQVCLFNEAPDAFKCSKPTGALSTKPGITCKYANDCGESQLCTELTTKPDSGTGVSTCYLFCWLTKPSGWTYPGAAAAAGRFAADGTCNVGGTNYGTCTSIGGIGGGLGLCVK
jgi:hypothetical protein